MDKLIEENNIVSTKIFSYLDKSDLSNTRLVSKHWRDLTILAMTKKHLLINKSLLNRIRKLYATSKSPDETAEVNHLRSYIEDYFKSCPSITVRGLVKLPNYVYDYMFYCRKTLKHLNLRGPGEWVVCRCPDSVGADDADAEINRLTELETLRIGTTFAMSSCVLLDLIKRSPNLKTLIFYGIIKNEGHIKHFEDDEVKSNLTTIHWPYFSKAPQEVYERIVRSSSKIEVLFGTENTTLDIIRSHRLPNLKALSINLSNKWTYGRIGENFQRVRDFSKLKEAKSIEILELRTHTYYDGQDDDDIDENTRERVENSIEQYQIAIWDTIIELPKLRALSVFGDWQFCKICRELAKRGMEIEFLSINLHPQSITECLEEGQECFYSADDGLTALGHLPKLKLFKLTCSEKVNSITKKTLTNLKSIVNSLYILDIKCLLTKDLEDFLSHLVKRGRVSGRVYKIKLYIVFDPQVDVCSVMMDTVLDFPIGTDFGEKLRCITKRELKERGIDKSYSSIHVWLVKWHAIVPKVKNEAFLKMEQTWESCFGLFDQDTSLQM